MGQGKGYEQEGQKVYQNLTQQANTRSKSNDRWTIYLILCCLTAAAASFVFGFNIGSTNLPTPLIKEFFARRYVPEYFNTKEKYENESKKLNEMNNATSEYQSLKTEIDQLNSTLTRLGEEKKKLTDFLWTIANCAFVVGGMIGAFTSKNVQDKLGRKKGIIFHHLFTIIGAVLTFIPPYVNSPECMIISRFFYGIQGGMSCGLIPTYLSEIAPAGLRGATGVIHQLFITIGILVAQTLGFRQLLGVTKLWHFLLAIPLIPGVVGSLVLLLFFSETPRALLINNRDEKAARIALKRLRNSNDIEQEIDEMRQEARESSSSNEAISIKELFTLSELRWPLITGLVLQLTQQLCGINAIFFYSESIFKNAKIEDSLIQYAVFSTGLVNVFMTIICVPLIDRLGRKPLLVFPMAVIILDFIALTVFLNLEGTLYSYLGIGCIIIFIMCFAVGLGPIPFVYVAECFRQDARSAALAICMFTNWSANLLLTLTFPYLNEFLKTYVFLVFTVIVGFALLVIIRKVPETKGKSVDEIMAHFEGRKPAAVKYESANEKLMGINRA